MTFFLQRRGLRLSPWINIADWPLLPNPKLSVKFSNARAENRRKLKPDIRERIKFAPDVTITADG